MLLVITRDLLVPEMDRIYIVPYQAVADQDSLVLGTKLACSNSLHVAALGHPLPLVVHVVQPHLPALPRAYRPSCQCYLLPPQGLVLETWQLLRGRRPERLLLRLPVHLLSLQVASAWLGEARYVCRDWLLSVVVVGWYLQHL